MARKTNIIWTPAVRRALYDILTRRFGAYETWEKVNSPGKGFDKQFDNFCDFFAAAIGAKSGDAVKHQIRFASPISENGVSWSNDRGSLIGAGILNLAAAYDAGFIEWRGFPSTMLLAGSGTHTHEQDQDNASE